MDYMKSLKNFRSEYQKMKASDEAPSRARQTTDALVQRIQGQATGTVGDVVAGLQRQRTTPEEEGPSVRDSMMAFLSAGRDEQLEREAELGQDVPTTRATSALVPRARGDVRGSEGLRQDANFMSELRRLEDKYPGLTEQEIFRTIAGESSFRANAESPAGARGLFQITQSAAEDAGINYDAILRMTPAQQLRAYEKYLDRWSYDGSVSLGIMQGAPAYRDASPDTVVYAKGTPAWEQNPGWRPADGGDITVASMNAYYRRH